MQRSMSRTREDGRTLSAGMLEDGVLLGVFFEGHNEGVIGLSVREALELASRIQAAYCPTCEGRKGETDGKECGDCARNRAQKEGVE